MLSPTLRQYQETKHLLEDAWEAAPPRVEVAPNVLTLECLGILEPVRWRVVVRAYAGLLGAAQPAFWDAITQVPS